MKKAAHFVSNLIIIKTIISFWRDSQYRSLVYVTLFVLIAGTVVYHYVEGWRWLDSLYFSVVTLTTVGLGDFAPKTDLGKLFTIFYIIVGIGIILTFIDAVYTHFNPTSRKKRAKEKK